MCHNARRTWASPANPTATSSSPDAAPAVAVAELLLPGAGAGPEAPLQQQSLPAAGAAAAEALS